jgi:hypothetical protein
MAYTDIDDPTIYFSTTLYTGDGQQNRAVTIDGTGMQPDWLWVKNRSAAEGHVVGDSVRGATKRLIPNAADEEATRPTNIASFTSTGFTVANGGVDGAVNTNNATYVSWAWKAGTSFTNDASSTSVGSIDSAGSFNNDAGFSIFTFTGTGSVGTIKHGLNTKPDVIIIKGRSDAKAWTIYHNFLGAGSAVFLQATDAAVDHDRYWNDVEPTTSVFTAGSSTNLSGNGITFVGYAFTAKQGYSKFGFYKGNDNANGSYVYTGFKPRWIMIKRTNSVNDFLILDTKRNPINPSNERILANTSAAGNTSNIMIDFLSNGFKARSTYGGINGDGDSFIYFAFAESPFVTSTGIPATAR